MNKISTSLTLSFAFTVTHRIQHLKDAMSQQIMDLLVMEAPAHFFEDPEHYQLSLNARNLDILEKMDKIERLTNLQYAIREDLAKINIAVGVSENLSKMNALKDKSKILKDLASRAIKATPMDGVESLAKKIETPEYPNLRSHDLGALTSNEIANLSLRAIDYDKEIEEIKESTNKINNTQRLEVLIDEDLIEPLAIRV